MSAMLLRGCRPGDILIREGRIAGMGADLAAPPGTVVEDARGLLALPAFVEGHAHLDKTLWGMTWYVNEVGPRLIDRIENERAQRGRLGLDPARQSARLAREFLARGTTRIRTHVDIDTEIGLRHVEALLELRDRLRGVQDIQVAGELGAYALDLLIERTRANGMAGQVTASHAFCLGEVARAPAVYEALAEAGIAIATTAPASRPVPAMRAARAAGVRIFTGNDGIRDTWTPYNTPDMLQRAMIVGLKNDLRRDDEIAMAFSMITDWAAEACGFERCGLTPGERADLVLVEAQNVAEAVVSQPPRRLVISHGRVVARDGVMTP